MSKLFYFTNIKHDFNITTNSLNFIVLMDSKIEFITSNLLTVISVSHLNFRYTQTSVGNYYFQLDFHLYFLHNFVSFFIYI